MLSTDCLGTQELLAFCKPTEIFEHSHPPEITLDKTAVGSELTNNQNGKICSVPPFLYLVIHFNVFSVTEFYFSSFECIWVILSKKMYTGHIIIAKKHFVFFTFDSTCKFVAMDTHTRKHA
jgi:hypothetical protein